MAGYIGNKAVNLSTSGADISGTANLDAVDIDGAVQIDATLSVGVNDTGYDVKFFGDAASAYMLWDASQDDLILGGAARLGIGTTTPSTPIHIVSTTPEITYADTTGDLFKMGVNNGVFRLYNITDSRQDLAIGGTGAATFSGEIIAASLDISGDVVLTAADSPKFESIDTTNTVTTRLFSGNSVGAAGTYSNHPFSLISNSTTKLKILENGGVEFTPEAGGHIVVNENGIDADFRIESDTDITAFFVEGSTGNIGMSTSDPDSHTPQTHNPNKRSFVSFFSGGTQFVAGRSDTAVVAGDYIGGYLFKTNDASTNKFGGMIATADDTSGNGNLEFFSVSGHYESSTTSEGMMQLDDNGDLYLRTGSIRVGRSHANVYGSTEENVTVLHTGSGSGDSFTQIVGRDGTGGDHVFRHQRQGVLKSEIEENGDFLSATNSYGSTSDGRLKENIVAASSQWDDIKALQFKNYSMIDAELDAPNMLGVIAQDLQAAGMNGLVKQNFKTNADDEPVLDADGNQEEYLSVKYSVLYMKAVKALQEAMAKIETLEARVTALEEV